MNKGKYYAILNEIQRLTQKQIDQYTRPSHKSPKVQLQAIHNVKPLKIRLRKLPLTANQSVIIASPQPKAYPAAPNVPKRHISGHPLDIQPQQPRQHTFCVQHHILKKCKGRMYVKC